MGNSPLITSLGNKDQSYFAQLGGPASIYIKGREVKQERNGEMTESWTMTYNVGESHYCHFALTKACAGNNNKFGIKIYDDDQCYSLTVQRADQAGLLHHSDGTINFKDLAAFYLSTTNSWGVITQMIGNVYGVGTSKGLIITERTLKNKDDREACMLTVRHYYACAENGNEVGLSVAVKRIRVSNGGYWDFVVDGPHQHPANALFYMFEEVRRTGTWKPTYCPHCANALIQKHDISWQSESEGSDMDNAPVHGRRHSAGGILANGGRFKGNNNGNLNIKYFNARRLL